jgi:hypothetical protein
MIAKQKLWERGHGEKCQKPPKYTQSHGFLDMNTWLKLNCLQKFVAREKEKLSISIENILIRKKLELPKSQLKSENHEIILHKTGYNLVKNGLILILFTFFRIYTQNATSFHYGKKCLDVCETNKQQ